MDDAASANGEARTLAEGRSRQRPPGITVIALVAESLSRGQIRAGCATA